ncbi:MAG: hypothetical protein L6R36_001206 [Xanthoria steineri]|nr:MAG: hypothetical protein L6R36_001206 [Xanthoria steineri]
MAPINPRTLTTAIVAFTTTALLFIYSRTSIRSAKRDAARHRAADGGQFNWRNESLRKHGALDRPEGPNLMGALFSSRKQKDNNRAPAASNKAGEEALQTAKGRRRAEGGRELDGV